MGGALATSAWLRVLERGGLPVPDQQPCAAPLVRLQAGERRAGHPVDSASPWAPLDCIDGSLHGARAALGPSEAIANAMRGT
jgi:hypothetical protein